jgi:hypothetical protein
MRRSTATQYRTESISGIRAFIKPQATFAIVDPPIEIDRGYGINFFGGLNHEIHSVTGRRRGQTTAGSTAGTGHFYQWLYSIHSKTGIGPPPATTSTRTPMTSQELIQRLGLQHLAQQDVEAVEEALNSDDCEVMLHLVDRLVGQAKTAQTKEREGHR